MIVLAAFVALHVDAASARSLQTLVPFGRLIYPSGYANANAAQWLMAFWPALLLARSGTCHGACGEFLLAARCCWPRSRCSARAAARCSRRP